MDKSVKEQDMAATLVSSLCVRGVVHNRDCEAGLEELLKSMPDLGIARHMPSASVAAGRAASFGSVQGCARGVGSRGERWVRGRRRGQLCRHITQSYGPPARA
jgi:hypothetical protein